MASETIRERNARIIENITAADFWPNEENLTDEEAKMYARYFDEHGYEIGFIGREFCAVPADGSPMDPYIMDEAMEPIREERQFEGLERMETMTRELLEREGRLEEVLAYYRPTVALANAENCRQLLGDRSTDENARRLCEWLNNNFYDLAIDRKGRMHARLNGSDLYPKALARAIRLALGDDNA